MTHNFFTQEELNILINALFLYLEKVQSQEKFDIARSLICKITALR